MYWASNSSDSTTTTGSPVSFEGGTTILVNNWSWFDIEPFPNLFDGDFWRWLYSVVMGRALKRRRIDLDRNRRSWSKRQRIRNREYRSRPGEMEGEQCND